VFGFFTIFTAQAAEEKHPLHHSDSKIIAKEVFTQITIPNPLPIQVTNTDPLAAEKLSLTKRQVEAAERSSRAAEQSAEYSKVSSNIAKKQIFWTRIGSFLSFFALLGPYGVLWINRWWTQYGANSSAQAAIEQSAKACREARDKNMNQSARSDQDIWIELTALSAARNVLKVRLDSGAARHEYLSAVSQCLQINFAMADALEMRLSKADSKKNLPLSNQILSGLEKRLKSADSLIKKNEE
ncbi:MAG: hypothetical protein ABF820_14040, partial [Sporolactobacillus sp.]